MCFTGEGPRFFRVFCVQLYNWGYGELFYFLHSNIRQKKRCLTSGISIHTLPFSLAIQTTIQVHYSVQEESPCIVQLYQQEQVAGLRTAQTPTVLKSRPLSDFTLSVSFPYWDWRQASEVGTGSELGRHSDRKIYSERHIQNKKSWD